MVLYNFIYRISLLCDSVLQEISNVASFNSLMLLLINFNQSVKNWLIPGITSSAGLGIQKFTKMWSSHLKLRSPSQVHFCCAVCGVICFSQVWWLHSFFCHQPVFQFFILPVGQKNFTDFSFVYMNCVVCTLCWLMYISLSADRGNDNWLIKYDMPDVDENEPDVSW